MNQFLNISNKSNDDSKKRNYSNSQLHANNHQSTDFDASKKFKPLNSSMNQFLYEKTRVNISTISKYSLKMVTTTETDTDNDLELDFQNGFLSNFFSNLKSYLIKTVPCDITLLLNNGKRLNAHKLILANSSCYFKRKIEQLSADLNENKVLIGENFYTIKLNDISDLKILKICIDFIYSGGSELSIDLNQVLDLHLLAIKLELTELIKLCEVIKLKYDEQNRHLTLSSNVNCNELTIPLLKIFQNLNDSNNSLQLIQSFYSNHNIFPNQDKQIIGVDDSSIKNESDLNCKSFIEKQEHKLRKHSKNDKRSSSNSSSPTTISSSSLSPSQWSISTSPIFMQNDNKYSDETDLKNTKMTQSTNGFNLFQDVFTLNKIKEYLNEKLLLKTSAFTSVNNILFEIDTIGSQFLILNKYIYPSMLQSQSDDEIIDLLKKCLENFTFINLESKYSNSKTELNSDFNRDALIVFCLFVGGNKFNNLLIRSKLNFADINALKEDVRQNLEGFLLKTLKHMNLTNNILNRFNLNININRLFYLKKPANCKTIRLDQIKSSTDCFRAIVEYSRFNEMNEKPFVFTTVHASVSIKFQ